jgi:hypothetical protein
MSWRACKGPLAKLPFTAKAPFPVLVTLSVKLNPYQTKLLIRRKKVDMFVINTNKYQCLTNSKFRIVQAPIVDGLHAFYINISVHTTVCVEYHVSKKISFANDWQLRK